MTVNDQLRRSSQRIQAASKEVQIPEPPVKGRRMMPTLVGLGLAAVAAIVFLIWIDPVGQDPGPATRDLASPEDLVMVRTWVEGALAGQFDDIAGLTYGESGEPAALAQLARSFSDYQLQYGEPGVSITPVESAGTEFGFACLAVDFGDFTVEGGMVVREWPDLGRRLWEFRTGMSGCSSGPPVTTTLPAVSAQVTPMEPGPLSGRVGHIVVWTGAEMIVWGGHAGVDMSDALNDGAAFDPDSGEWRSLGASPLDGATWHFAAWDGDEMLIVGTSGAAAYDPADDSWRLLPAVPIPIHRVAERISDLTEYAWSGSHLYVWNPISDELARLDPSGDAWETIEGPGLNVLPAKILADRDRLIVFGTRWPGGPAEPSTYELLSAELVDGTWVDLAPIGFLTDEYANVADPGTASFVGELVLVWGDPSSESGDARLLHPDGSWTSVPPPPIDENILHPTPIQLDGGRVLALSGGGNAAIWEPTLNDWTPVGPLPAILGDREAVWTGRELIAWSGGESWRWVPPPPSNAPTQDDVTYTRNGNTYIRTDCPIADPILRGNADGLPAEGQTEESRVTSMVDTNGDSLVAEWSAQDIRVIPRKGQVWREAEGGGFEVIDVADYQIELISGPDSTCPSAPYAWNGIPVIFTGPDG